MTVISAMKFATDEGAIISDSQATSGIREGTFSTKLYALDVGNGVLGVMGGTGTAEFFADVSRRITAAITGNEAITRGTHLAAAINTTALDTKREYINNYLKATFGISEAEFQTGHLILPGGTRTPIEPALMRTYHDIVTSTDGATLINKITNNSILVLTYASEGMGLFKLSTALGTILHAPLPYDAIGSGQDMAETELYAFFEHVPRDQFTAVDRIDGLVALLTATERASARNVGVGGSPAISIIRDKHILTPSEQACLLAQEIVLGTRRGYLPDAFQKTALEALLYTRSAVAPVEQEMFAVATDRDKLDKLLRRWKDHPPAA